MLRPDELVVDNFAGGGGASTGIEQALDELGFAHGIDVALNHDEEACAMYRANHPRTEVMCQSVYKADPRDVVLQASRRRGSDTPLPVGLGWFSPDCTDHSKAKGGAPIRSRASRDLAWVIVHWAKLVGPRVIMMENVEEWLGWGPLRQRRWPDGREMTDLHGNPVLERDPDRAGETFTKWHKALERPGRGLRYNIEFRELRASKYGAPTIRKRLLLIARRDDVAISWPAETHGPGLLPYRTAAECIDWSIPCPSIFERKRPLADATMRRIARGVKRYVLDAAKPFIVGLAHGHHVERPGARCHDTDEPVRTIHAGGGNFAIVQPFIAPITHHGDDRVHAIDDPLRTVTTANRGELALIAPVVVGCGGRAGQSRPRGGDEPMATLTAKADSCFVAATLVQSGYGERDGQAPRALDIEKPLGTVVGTPKHALVAAFLAQHNGGERNENRVMARSADEPLSTTTTRGTQQQVVAAILSHQYSSNTAGGQGDPDQPIKTITTGGHAALVAAFMQKYYSMGGQDAPADEPMHTLTTKARMGLVTITIAGEPYVIVDIGMRMLTPRELFNAQGFPPDYVINPMVNGKPLTKTAQIRMCGNSVCPPLARALVLANFGGAQRAAEVA